MACVGLACERRADTEAGELSAAAGAPAQEATGSPSGSVRIPAPAILAPDRERAAEREGPCAIFQRVASRCAARGPL